MIKVTITGSIVTVSTKSMELVVSLSMWLNRDSRRTIINIAQGE